MSRHCWTLSSTNSIEIELSIKKKLYEKCLEWMRDRKKMKLHSKQRELKIDRRMHWRGRSDEIWGKWSEKTLEICVGSQLEKSPGRRRRERKIEIRDADTEEGEAEWKCQVGSWSHSLISSPLILPFYFFLFQLYTRFYFRERFTLSWHRPYLKVCKLK